MAGDVGAPIVEIPCCPRCGYDLRGPVALWRERCPLEGVCPECGLGYAWLHVFRPEWLTPRWSFEHTNVRLIRCFCSTVMRTLGPGTFWKRMRVESPVRPWRLLVLGLGTLLLVHLLIALMWGAVGYYWATKGYALGWLPGVVEPYNTMWSFAIWPYKAGDSFNMSATTIAPFTIFVWGLATAVPFLLLGRSMRLAKVRRRHLIRGWACFVPTACMALLVPAVFIAVMGSALQTWLSPNLTWRFYTWGVVLALPVALWYWWWWRAFVGSYLRLRHAGLTSALMLIVSGLGVVAIAAYSLGDLFTQEIGWLWVMLTR